MILIKKSADFPLHIKVYQEINEENIYLMPYFSLRKIDKIIFII